VSNASVRGAVVLTSQMQIVLRDSLREENNGNNDLLKSRQMSAQPGLLLLASIALDLDLQRFLMCAPNDKSQSSVVTLGATYLSL